MALLPVFFSDGSVGQSTLTAAKNKNPRSTIERQNTDIIVSTGIILHSSPVIPHSSFIIHHLSFVTHHSTFFIRHSSFVISIGRAPLPSHKPSRGSGLTL